MYRVGRRDGISDDLISIGIWVLVSPNSERAPWFAIQNRSSTKQSSNPKSTNRVGARGTFYLYLKEARHGGWASEAQRLVRQGGRDGGRPTLLSTFLFLYFCFIIFYYLDSLELPQFSRIGGRGRPRGEVDERDGDNTRPGKCSKVGYTWGRWHAGSWRG